jgi:hypothetical protein
MQSARQVDLINFLLIWMTLGLAFLFPFELFLFSYAVLGPLHYMTEINWLEKKNYFLNSVDDKKLYLFIVIAVLTILSLAFFIGEAEKWDFSKGLFSSMIQSNFGHSVGILNQWGYSVIFVALIIAVVFYYTNSSSMRWLFLCLSTLITFLFFRHPVFTTWFGIFLPTILHVFLFTILFMLSGTQKSKSPWGVANLFAMLLVVPIIVFADVTPGARPVANDTMNAWVMSNFHTVNFKVGTVLGLIKEPRLDIYSPVIWKIQVFIAFAYTYHYLNWFSKTSVIQWHKIDRKKMRMTIALWLSSVVLYYINYRLGFVALFVFSMLHVILEFPLNITTIKGLFIRPERILQEKKSIVNLNKSNR